MRWHKPASGGQPVHQKVAAIFGLFSTMIVNLLGQTRIFYSMSRDGLLPPLFARVHPRFRTPHVSTMLTGCIIALVAGLTPINALSQLVSIGTLLAFVLVSIGVIVLRKTAPNLPRPFKTPVRAGRAHHRRDHLPRPDDRPAHRHVGAPDHLARHRAGRVLRVRAIQDESDTSRSVGSDRSVEGGSGSDGDAGGDFEAASQPRRCGVHDSERPNPECRAQPAAFGQAFSR